MSNAKHTPGPWEVIVRDNGSCLVTDQTGNMSVKVSHHTRRELRGVQSIANARLIAAAPELLFSIDRILRELPQRRDWLDPVTEQIAKAAIAKARGE